jgi:paraquat-inducible protein A
MARHADAHDGGAHMQHRHGLLGVTGRWSSVDIFVAALLTALVTLGNLATIEPGLGVLAFGGVVFVTMLATDDFDTRLMWDAAGANDAQ